MGLTPVRLAAAAVMGMVLLCLTAGALPQEPGAGIGARGPAQGAQEEKAKGKNAGPEPNEPAGGAEALLVPNQQGEQGRAPGGGWGDFVKSWEQFRDFGVMARIVFMVLLALACAAAIAYHPRSYGKAATLEEVDQPKIFLMYALVGTVCGQIVVIEPTMSFVIFGLGGLFRFRTEVGPARDTGRVILATLIGVCCGISLFMVAILATAVGWLLIYYLEGRVTHKVIIKGLEPSVLAQAADAYGEVLVENGFTIKSEKKNFVKKQVAFVFRAPGALDREELEELFKDIPPRLQGAVDWESS